MRVPMRVHQSTIQIVPSLYRIRLPLFCGGCGAVMSSMPSRFIGGNVIACVSFKSSLSSSLSSNSVIEKLDDPSDNAELLAPQSKFSFDSFVLGLFVG